MIRLDIYNGFPRWFFGLCLLVFCIISCKAAPDKKSSSVDAASDDIIVVKVNDTIITKKQIVRRIQSIHGEIEESKTDPIMWQRLYEAAAEEEMFETLLYDAAKKEGMHADKQQVADAYAKSTSMMGEDQFADMLAKQQATESEYKSFLSRMLLIDAYKKKLTNSVIIEEQELQEYFTGHAADQLAPETVRLEVFLVKKEAEANRLFAEIQAGGDFDDLVARYVTGNNNIGKRTRFMPYNALPQELQNPVTQAEPGIMIPPVKTQEGFYVVNVLEKKPGGKVRFEDVKEELQRTLMGKKQQTVLMNWYDQAKQKASIEYMKASGRK